MSVLPFKLLLGPHCILGCDEDGLKSKFDLKMVNGFYLHIVHFKAEYSKFESPRDDIVAEKIGYLLDYYPWMINLSVDDPKYLPLSRLRNVNDSKDSYESLEQELKMIYGEDILVIWIVNRPGLVTGWSSKVSGLLNNTDLSQYIAKAERGFVYVVKTNDTRMSKMEALGSYLSDSLLYESYIGSLPPAISLMFEQIPSLPRVRHIALPRNFCKESFEKRIVFFSGLDSEWTLGLGEDNLTYLASEYGRKTCMEDDTVEIKNTYDFTDAELNMFCQVNSDHCRHLTFNSHIEINNSLKQRTLFEMIKNTYQKSKSGILSAYKDNGAVLEGSKVSRLIADPRDRIYKIIAEDVHIVAKAETHNHPTAIDPFNGAATGMGGEIRDEAACGIGATPICGFSGIILSNLNIPGFTQPWEDPLSSSLNQNFLTQRAPFRNKISAFYSAQNPSSPFSASQRIIIKAPLGSSHYCNEFGRPVLSGFFRTYTESVVYEGSTECSIIGFHKPVVLCGGMGLIRPQNTHKKKITPGCLIIVLGEPAVLVGLGGGSTSSKVLLGSSGDASSSVQRANAEAERICQAVIDSCVAYGEDNPIISIHDVGAGGLSNALPELVEESGVGISIDLRSIPINHTTMSPMEILCTESQERYVLAIKRENMGLFKELCHREKCHYGCVGVAIKQREIRVYDNKFGDYPVRMSTKFLFKNLDNLVLRDVTRNVITHPVVVPSSLELKKLAHLILRVPAVASKSFLITIGDRSITGLVSRDQMIGPWQVPVADAAVTFLSHTAYKGHAVSLGEKPLIALIDPAASARMAVGEAITNILSSDVEDLQKIKLSANWMADASTPGMKADIYKAVEAIGMHLCPDLNIAIPVGKDSMSMSMTWRGTTSDEKSDESFLHHVVSPVTAAIAAYAPVRDVRNCLTPQLADNSETTVLLFIDMACGNMRLGGSCLSQVLNTVGNNCPDVYDPKSTLIPLSKFMSKVRSSNGDVEILAYHDRSDGGLFVTLAEMCFSGRMGCVVDISSIGDNDISTLFNEELGVVIQVRVSEVLNLITIATDCGLRVSDIYTIGEVNDSDRLIIMRGCNVILDESIVELYKEWSQMSYKIQALRGNKSCADSEYSNIPKHFAGKGLSHHVGYDLAELKNVSPLTGDICSTLRVAVLRENGSNGHVELAYSFQSVGFEVHDLIMSDIISGKVNLNNFVGIGFPGGFSNGDVLGSGAGWAKSILMNATTRSKFEEFFGRKDKFVIGICNGCQLLSYLKEIIPGSDRWPLFVQNESGVFESRLCRVKIRNSSSNVFLEGMDGSILTVPVAHGEGRAFFGRNDVQLNLQENTMRDFTPFTYVDNEGNIAVGDHSYPYNPSGTVFGIAGMTSEDGRILGMMPHPERSVRMYQNNWGFDKTSKHSGLLSSLEWSPWIKMFLNSYKWSRRVSTQ